MPSMFILDECVGNLSIIINSPLVLILHLAHFLFTPSSVVGHPQIVVLGYFLHDGMLASL